MRDLYMRSPDDPYYQTSILEVSDEIECLVSQIKMMLLTSQGEILGAPDFGINLEEQLFTLNRNEFSIRSMLVDQTMKFIPLAEKHHVTYSVKFTNGTVRDICLINVAVDNSKAFGLLVK